MARTKKNAAKAPETAQDARQAQGVSQDTQAAEVPQEDAQAAPVTQEIIGPENPEDLLGCQDEAMDEAELEEGTLTEYAVTAEGGLRLRDGPSLDAQVIATLPWGAGVFAGGEAEGEWIPVTTGLLSGYMMVQYLIPLTSALKMAVDHE